MTRITDYLIEDHVRLGALLARARGTPFDHEAYATFRAGLLRHIAIEEKVLFRAAPTSRAAALRQDHAKIAALLAPRPTPASCSELAALLERHDALEEGPGGVYGECEGQLSAIASLELVTRARDFPDVRVAPYREREEHV